ncbi:MAG TPA: type II CAAX endopeptidase family protein [Candidatus Acidoferrales bacterium]|jgi:membrane protease YdiL (CAAX protease family)|nr:type II CAAX endopeptidase family protein [Candidatus Acidoferrales bacterium]
MPSSLRRLVAIAWSAILAFLILALGQGVWVALFTTNLKTSPKIPWAVVVMAVVLWAMWQYLGGKWWPRSTSEARHRYLRARRVSSRVFVWAMVAGVLSIVALTGYWIVMFQLVKMPANTLPDMSSYPLLTIVLMRVMASLVSPLTEEAGFRGYCQVILEREFRGPVAVVISSVLFALAHFTQGFFWPKLLVYFLAGLVFGVTAYLTNSILPGIPVHILADMTFFALVWPHDAARRMVWKSGADGWFWFHVAQAVVFTALAIFSFRRLARVAPALPTR